MRSHRRTVHRQQNMRASSSTRTHIRVHFNQAELLCTKSYLFSAQLITCRVQNYIVEIILNYEWLKLHSECSYDSLKI